MKFIKYLVIGSGISSYAFLSTHNNDKKKRTLVVTGKSKKKVDKLDYDRKKLDFDIRYEFGGLANSWLGGYSDFNKGEIFSISNKISKNLYKSFSQFKIKTKLYNYYNSIKHRLPKFIHELQSQKKSNLELFKINILSNFLSFNKKIMKPKKIKKIKYIDGYVTAIKKDGKFYEINILIGKKNIKIKSEFVFLAC